MTYPWLESDIKLGKQLFKKYPEIGKYVKQLFVHKIGSFVQFQITPFLIYFYVSLPVVALYGNYTIITQRVQGFISSILDSTSAGIGNLISEGNKEKIYKTYKELFAVRFLISGILTACIFHLCNAFISIWLGDEYPLSSLILLLISIQFFLAVFRGTTDQFIFGYGLFYDVWAPAVESAIFIVTTMIAGSIWELPGVLCGPLISTIVIVYMWKPYFLFHKGLKKSILLYIKEFCIHLFAILVAYLIAELLAGKIFNQVLSASWKNWILGALLFTSLMTVFSTILFYCTSSGFRSFIHRFIKK